MSNRKALFHLRTLPSTVLALAAVSASGSALAQANVANGETLYKQKITVPVTGSVACQDCHGPAFIFKRSAAQISAAIAANRGGMNIYASWTAAQIGDIAAYMDAAQPPTTPPLALPPGSPAPAPAPAPPPAPAPGTPTNKPTVAMSSPMFSSTEVSKYSQTIGLQVTNSTTAPIVLSNPALIPPAGTMLEFVAAKPPAGTKECKPLDLLDVGMSCSFGVQFAPLNAGTRTEKWTIKFEGNVPAVEVTLEGTAIAVAAGSTSPTTAPTTSSANAPTDGGGGALGWLSLLGLSSFLALGSARRRLS